MHKDHIDFPNFMGPGPIPKKVCETPGSASLLFTNPENRFSLVKAYIIIVHVLRGLQINILCVCKQHCLYLDCNDEAKIENTCV